LNRPAAVEALNERLNLERSGKAEWQRHTKPNHSLNRTRHRAALKFDVNCSPVNAGVMRLPLTEKTAYYSRMKVKEVIKLLEKDGWYLARTRGSHHQFKHWNKSGTVTVSGKPSIDVPPGTLNSILKQAGLK
jgi:predicted RNA binding protein YcfA (HicA-like mRNA interferase family)